MAQPFGLEYLEPMSLDERDLTTVQGGQNCVLVDTFHTKSKTHTLELVCDD